MGEEIKCTIKCDSCKNVTRRIRVTDDTPVRVGGGGGVSAAVEIQARAESDGDVESVEALRLSVDKDQTGGSMSTVPKTKATTSNMMGGFDVSLFMDMVNDAVAEKMKSLEARLVVEIRAAVSSISEQEKNRLKAELMEANEKCRKLEAEVKDLKTKIENQSSSKNKVQKQKATKNPQTQKIAEVDCEIVMSPVSVKNSTVQTPVAATSVKPPALSYAAVATKTAVSATAGVKQDLSVRTEAQNGNWIEVKHNKNPVKRGENCSVTTLKAVERKKYLHLWRLDKSTTEESLTQYIKGVIGICELFVYKLKPREERNYASFKVGVPEHFFEKLCNPEIWPLNIEFSEWTFFRRTDFTTKPPQPS